MVTTIIMLSCCFFLPWPPSVVSQSHKRQALNQVLGTAQGTLRGPGYTGHSSAWKDRTHTPIHPPGSLSHPSLQNNFIWRLFLVLC